MTDLQNKRPGENYGSTTQALERDIDQTRQAISDDLKALGAKLDPEHLKAGAREMIAEAKEGAKEVLRDAKEVASESLNHAKENAMGVVSETMGEIKNEARRMTGEIKDEARRLTHVTTEFATRNAVPLTLIGLGAGWLMLSLRKPRQARAFAWDETRAGFRGGSHPESTSGWDESRAAFHGGREPSTAVTQVRDKIAEVSDRTLAKAHEMSEKVAHASHDMTQSAAAQWQRGKQGATTFVRENPLAVAAAVAAAGVGVGMLLPTTDIENQWMGEARDQLVRETKEVAGDLRETTERLARNARDAVREVQNVARPRNGLGE